MALGGLAACGGLPSSEQQAPLTPQERLRNAGLGEFEPAYNRIAAFAGEYGFLPAIYNDIGDTIIRVAVNEPGIMDNVNVPILQNGWGTKIKEIKQMRQGLDMSAVPQAEWDATLELLVRLYHLFPGFYPVAPEKLTLTPESDIECGPNTLGCTDGWKEITMEMALNDPKTFYFIALHELTHNLEAQLASKLQYYHRQHFLPHYNKYLQFFIDTGLLVRSSDPRVLMEYGQYGRHTQETDIGPNGELNGSLSRRFDAAFKAVQPHLAPTDIPPEAYTGTVSEYFDKTRFPLFRKVLQLLHDNAEVDGIRARQNSALTLYAQAYFNHLQHITVDPMFHTNPAANPFQSFIEGNMREIQATRLEMVSHGAVPANYSIEQIRKLLHI